MTDARHGNTGEPWPGYTAPPPPGQPTWNQSGAQPPPPPGQPTWYQGGAQPPPPPQRSWFTRHKIITGIGGFFAVLIVIGVISSIVNPQPTTVGTATATPTAAPRTESAAPAPTKTPSDKPAKAPAAETVATKPAAPRLTVSEENAIAKAESYLDFQAFSKKGLISQLKFDGFSTKDASFAVDNVTVNWKEQAAKKAKSYLELQPFSRSGLISQLKFDGFSSAEAAYGVSKTGL